MRPLFMLTASVGALVPVTRVAYIFAVTDGFAMAFPPARPNADVTLVRFDSAFVERSRRIVKLH